MPELLGFRGCTAKKVYTDTLFMTIQLVNIFNFCLTHYVTLLTIIYVYLNVLVVKAIARKAVRTVSGRAEKRGGACGGRGKGRGGYSAAKLSSRRLEVFLPTLPLFGSPILHSLVGAGLKLGMKKNQKGFNFKFLRDASKFT